MDRARRVKRTPIERPTAEPAPVLPLRGLRVIDLSQVLAGPYATWALAGLGAEVIKVEPPAGDASRKVGPFFDGMSLYHGTVNAGKQIVVDDLTTEDGRARLDDLLADADILVHNMRSHSAARLHLAPQQVLARHPKLVIVTIGGFADGIPEGGRAAYDLVIQALSGIMSITGYPDREPVRAGVPVSDLSAGLWAAIAALAGLRHRDVHGRGGHLEVPMLDASLSLLTYMGTGAATTGVVPGRIGNEHPSVVPYGSFEAVDGHLVIAVYSDKFWHPLCRALDLWEMEADGGLDLMVGRVARRAEVNAAVRGAVAGRTRTATLEALESHDVPCAPVLDVCEALQTPYVQQRGAVLQMEEEDVRYGMVAGPLRGITGPA